MKKISEKQFVLDTCILKLFLQIKGEKDNIIEEKLNLKTLKNYLRHHRPIITPFTLLETFRQDVNDNSINLLERLNPIILNKKYLIENHNLLETLKNDNKKDILFKKITLEIKKATAAHFSYILLFPLGFITHVFTQNIPHNNEYFNYIHNYFIEYHNILYKKILENFEKIENFNKTNILKTIEKIYKILNCISADWCNNEANDVYKNQDSISLNLAMESLKSKLHEIDLFENDKLNANGNINFFFKFYELIKQVTPNIPENFDSLLINFSEMFIKAFYSIKDEEILNIFIKKNIKELFLRHIKDKKSESHPEKRIKKIIDSNDIIDCINLMLAYNNNYIFLTTDGKLNGIISTLYEDISPWKDFIKNINKNYYKNNNY